jgi:hypothetical protein
VLKGDVHIHFEAPLLEKQKGGKEGTEKEDKPVAQ